MNHEAQATLKGAANQDCQAGRHMSAQAGIVVPASSSFSRPPPGKIVIDMSKVSVQKG